MVRSANAKQGHYKADVDSWKFKKTLDSLYKTIKTLKRRYDLEWSWSR